MKPNYALINDGQGPLSNSMNYDPNEVAPTALAGAGPNAQNAGILGSNLASKTKENIVNAKKRGFNLKADIFNKCQEVFKAFQENENYRKLVTVVAQPDTDTETTVDSETKKKLVVILDKFDEIEMNMNSFAYQSAIAYTMDVNKNIQALVSLLLPIPTLSNLPLVLFSSFDQAIKNEKLADKEIYSIGEIMKPPGMVKTSSIGGAADSKND